jgi:hypothetical protein
MLSMRKVAPNATFAGAWGVRAVEIFELILKLIYVIVIGAVAGS